MALKTVWWWDTTKRRILAEKWVHALGHALGERWSYSNLWQFHSLRYLIPMWQFCMKTSSRYYLTGRRLVHGRIFWLEMALIPKRHPIQSCNFNQERKSVPALEKELIDYEQKLQFRSIEIEHERSYSFPGHIQRQCATLPTVKRYSSNENQKGKVRSSGETELHPVDHQSIHKWYRTWSDKDTSSTGN